jgi:hypothetical protein
MQSLINRRALDSILATTSPDSYDMETQTGTWELYDKLGKLVLQITATEANKDTFKFGVMELNGYNIKKVVMFFNYSDGTTVTREITSQIGGR